MCELDVVLYLCAGGEGWRLDSNNQCRPEEHEDWAASGSGEAHQIPVDQGQGHTQGSLTTGHEVKAVTSIPLTLGFEIVPDGKQSAAFIVNCRWSSASSGADTFKIETRTRSQDLTRLALTFCSTVHVT